ncbi:MAG TPA: condensation domain-containing protein, partial [Thermoanaerobaculia bacterium]
GHSLTATQVLSRVRDAFGVDLSLAGMFRAPTIAGLAGQLAEAQSGERAAPSSILRLPRGADGTPRTAASFAQRRLWFLDRFEPGSVVYNLPFAQDLRGRLDVAALRSALSGLVSRHEALRTVFALADGEPIQVVRPARAAAPRLPIVDLAALPDAVRTAEGDRLSWAEANRPFDLETGPLLRVLLLRRGERDHRLILSSHHITSDAWSLGVVEGELATLYRAFATGDVPLSGPLPLPPLPVQYADFAAWQRDWLQGEELDRQLAYWQARLAGAPETLDLPADRHRPAIPTHRGAIEPIAVPAALAADLQQVGRGLTATLFMTLLAAFQALLGRTTGQEDVVVGSPVANRNRAETEGLIGFFVNTLALRADLGGDPPFAALLDQVKDGALGAYAHQDVPFEKLVEVLAPERDLSRSPLFQVAFALQNAPRKDLDLGPDLAADLVELPTATAKFDLSLLLTEAPGGALRGEIEYSTDLFDRATVQRFDRCFQTLLAGVAADPERRLSELPLLGDGERAQILVDWSGWDGEPLTAANTVQDLIERQVALRPDAPAVET